MIHYEASVGDSPQRCERHRLWIFYSIINGLIPGDRGISGHKQYSYGNSARNAGDDISPDPDRPINLMHKDAARPAQGGALTGDILWGCGSAFDQPLGDRGIQASRNGVFPPLSDPGKGTDFELGIVRCVTCPNHPDHLSLQCLPIRSKGQHIGATAQSQHQPSRAIIRPLGIQNIRRGKAQGKERRHQVGMIDGAGTAPRRGGKGQTVFVQSYRNKARTAFLYDQAGF